MLCLQAVVALSNGLIQVNVSTGTGRLLSLEDVTSGLTTPLTTEVGLLHCGSETFCLPRPLNDGACIRPMIARQQGRKSSQLFM